MRACQLCGVSADRDRLNRSYAAEGGETWQCVDEARCQARRDGLPLFDEDRPQGGYQPVPWANVVASASRFITPSMRFDSDVSDLPVPSTMGQGDRAYQVPVTSRDIREYVAHISEVERATRARQAEYVAHLSEVVARRQRTERLHRAESGEEG